MAKPESVPHTHPFSGTMARINAAVASEVLHINGLGLIDDDDVRAVLEPAWHEYQRKNNLTVTKLTEKISAAYGSFLGRSLSVEACYQHLGLRPGKSRGMTSALLAVYMHELGVPESALLPEPAAHAQPLVSSLEVARDRLQQLEGLFRKLPQQAVVQVGKALSLLLLLPERSRTTYQKMLDMVRFQVGFQSSLIAELPPAALLKVLTPDNPVEVMAGYSQPPQDRVWDETGAEHAQQLLLVMHRHWFSVGEDVHTFTLRWLGEILTLEQHGTVEDLTLLLWMLTSLFDCKRRYEERYPSLANSIVTY